ncbi:hypothetical protein L2E82_42705 [Cichorium intybus]|uniref:Uncharacterized protein n=1 Tax=Cichorium intybus TaxID=13427 RepID=A0ACB8ZRU5_CICIN|nr:hypothetical protein L2E82_42705 [Cichorium intybus]
MSKEEIDFVDFLEKEIEKFNLFFVEKEEEYIIKLKFFRKPPWKEEPVLASLLIMQLQAYELTGLISPLIFKAVGSLYFLVVSDLFVEHTKEELLINRSSASLETFLSMSIGYFLSDLAMIIWTYPTLGGFEYIPESTKSIPGWNGIEYKTAFPMQKPAGASFYPPDMDKMEFELWAKGLSGDEKQDATGFFSVIKRHRYSQEQILRVDRKKRGFGMKPTRVALIREIKQLKTLRDELAANMGSQDEAQQAMLEKYQNRGTYEGMLTLRKELEVLKNEVTKAEAATSVVGKKYDEISKREREMQAQFRTADYM